MKLTHTNNKETIEVLFHCQDEDDNMQNIDPEEFEEHENSLDEDDEEASVGVKFHVTISKKHTADKLVIFGVANESIRVDNVQYLPAGKTLEDTSIYHGPIFDNLSEDLQNSIYNFLADRHIDDDMAFFILAYSENKEQREYMNWLKKFMVFVEAK